MDQSSREITWETTHEFGPMGERPVVIHYLYNPQQDARGHLPETDASIDVLDVTLFYNGTRITLDPEVYENMWNVDFEDRCIEYAEHQLGLSRLESAA